MTYKPKQQIMLIIRKHELVESLGLQDMEVGQISVNNRGDLNILIEHQLFYKVSERGRPPDMPLFAFKKLTEKAVKSIGKPTVEIIKGEHVEVSRIDLTPEEKAHLSTDVSPFEIQPVKPPASDSE